MIEIIGYTSVFLMGIVLGLVGGGGSILTVPILVYLFGMNPIAATGYSLFIVGVTALVGAARNHRNGLVRYKTGFLFALPSVAGVYFSRLIILPNIPENLEIPPGISFSKSVLIMTLFSLLMLAAAKSMIRPSSSKATKPSDGSRQLISTGFKGLVTGMLTGLVGAGGGFLIVPALVILAGLEMKVAVGTSLAIIAFNSLLGFAADLYLGTIVDWSLLLSLSGLAALGILIGVNFAKKVPDQTLKKGFGWFVLIMGAFVLSQQIFS